MENDYQCVVQFRQIFCTRPFITDVCLISEEVSEFGHAETLIDQIDAIADIIYTVYGLAIVLGYSFPMIQPSPISWIGDQSTTHLKLRCEVDCLRRALLSHDWTQSHHRIKQILSVCYTYGHEVLQIKVSEAVCLVHQSNLTKLCQSELDAINTIKWYQEHLSDRYPTPAYRRANDRRHWVVYDQMTRKILKSRSFHPPCFGSELFFNQRPIDC